MSTIIETVHISSLYQLRIAVFDLAKLLEVHAVNFKRFKTLILFLFLFHFAVTCQSFISVCQEIFVLKALPLCFLHYCQKFKFEISCFSVFDCQIRCREIDGGQGIKDLSKLEGLLSQ